ncbi:MAG: LysR family substrate-binding domain-containing protein [Pseudomonadota bacterium]
MDDTLTSANDETNVELAVGLFGSICRDRLGDELLAFARHCPTVGLGVHEMSRAALLPALEAGELALAVMPGGVRPELQSAPLWTDRVMVAMAQDHPLAARPAVTAAALRDMVFLVSRQQDGNDMHRFLSHCIRPLAPALNGMLLDLGPAHLMERVARGEGLALVCASHTDALPDDVVVRPVDAPGALFPVRAWWKEAEPAWPLSELIRILLSSRRD